MYYCEINLFFRFFVFAAVNRLLSSCEHRINANFYEVKIATNNLKIEEYKSAN